MAVRHMAWIRFREGIPPARMEEHMRACRGLADSIPVVERVECGETFSNTDGVFTHGIIVSVADQERLNEYFNHPALGPVSEPLLADVDKVSVMEIEY